MKYTGVNRWYSKRIHSGKYLLKKGKRVIEVYDSYDFHVAAEDVLTKVKMFIEKEQFYKLCKKLPREASTMWRNKKSGKVPEGQGLFI